jgi:hypothetical protein
MRHGMTARRLPSGPIFWGLLLLAGSCARHDREPEHDAEGKVSPETLVTLESPPPLRAEIIRTPPPTANHVWVAGYWTRHEERWTWVHGRWCERPRPNAVWVGGHWEKDSQGYAYTPGYWKE